MLRIRVSRFFFSESIAETFKSRSRLFEFFKHTHPDVLSSAPERIREENLRSLKVLNNYIDSLSQNKGVEEHRLKFYIADKAKKAKKYYFFDVSLGALKENVPEDLLKRHLDNTVNSLMGSLKTRKIQTDPKLKEEYEKENEKVMEEEKIQETLSTLKPIKKGSNILNERVNNFIESQYTNASLFNFVHRHRIQSIMDTINEKLFYFEREGVKPILWSKILFSSMEYNDQVIDILNYLIDPRMVFIDKSLSFDEITTFQNLIVPKEGKTILKTRIKEMQKIFADMENNKPQIMLYVSKGYDAEKMPGFLTIPFNFKYKEMAEFYYTNKEAILERRDQYKTLIERLENIQSSLSKKLPEVDIALPKTVESSILDSLIIALKLLDKESEGLRPLGLRKIEVGTQEAWNLENKKLTVPLKFSIDSLKKAIKI